MLTKTLLDKLKISLVKHEGYRNFAYTDPVGKITIGIGYNLSDRGLTDDWINKQYQQDVLYFYNSLYDFLWYRELNADRQIILIDMAFMGLKRLMGFTKMLAALEAKDYKRAASEMLDSDWAREVKGRALDLATAMEKGRYDIE